MFSLFNSTESMVEPPLQQNNNPQQRPDNGNLIPPQSTQQGAVSEKIMSNGGTRYLCNITGDIGECDAFFYLIHILNNATANDHVILNIASSGGSIETGIHIIQAMFHTKAKVTTYAMGLAASIAAVVWACGHRRYLSDVGTLMFHMPSSFHFGKTQDTVEDASYMVSYFTQLLKLVTKDILTEEEIEQVVAKRKDVFISDLNLNTKLNGGGDNTK